MAERWCSFSRWCVVGPNDKLCLPKHFFPHFAKLTQGLDHVLKVEMLALLTKNWLTQGFSVYAQKHCQACIICTTHKAGKTKPRTQAVHLPTSWPLERLMIDFTGLTASEGKKYCLVMVDMWSQWFEAFPWSKQNSAVVAKVLLREMIPRWGIPAKISSDNETPFINEIITQVNEFLGIDFSQHCTYHPARVGTVETLSRLGHSRLN